MRKKVRLVMDEDFVMDLDLTLHNFPAQVMTEFSEKIVRPYYNGNLNAAMQDLMHKAISEQEFLLSHVTQVQRTLKAEN